MRSGTLSFARYGRKVAVGAHPFLASLSIQRARVDVAAMPAWIPLKVMALLLIPLAPLPYWALGLPWCARGDLSRMPLSPLVGCALAGFYAELALIAGLPPRATVAVLTLASAAVGWAFARDARIQLRETVRDWAPLYLVSVIASSVAPFPELGDWSGDWYLLYQMGTSVMHGALPSGMLARPPLFGAAAAPLWILGPGLIPYQMMSAVAAASTVLATLYFIDSFWPKSPRWLLLPLLLSPFFLHNTAAAWGKLLAGGLVLAAVIEARRARVWTCGAFFALSVAVHEGSIIWLPCVLVAFAGGQRGWRAALRALPGLALTGLAIVGPLLLWVLFKYGLAAKVDTNPALTARNQEPFVLKTAAVVITTFIGWAPLQNLARWARNPQRLSSVVIAKEGYWFLTSWFTTMAGTLLGLLFPFVLCWRRLRDSPILRRLMRPAVLLSLGFALIANGILCGYSSTEGSLQTGMAALALGAYGLLAGAARAAGAPAFRRMSWAMGVLGTLPWALGNLFFALGLWGSPMFRARLEARSEPDYTRVMTEHLGPLGMAAFPEVPVVALLLLLGAVWATRRATALAPPGPQPGSA